MSFLEEKGYAIATANRKIASVKSFFDYLVAQIILKANPMKGMNLYKRKITFQPRLLTAQEMTTILGFLRRSPRPDRKRDAVIFELFSVTGVTTGELVSLDVDMLHLDPKNPYLKVGHNRKERVIRISSWVAGNLKQCLEEIRLVLISGKKEKALFVNRKGERLTRQGVWFNLKKHAQAAGLEEQINPSTLRHSFASSQVARGILLEELQQILGHRSIGTTSKYRKIKGRKVPLKPKRR